MKFKEYEIPDGRKAVFEYDENGVGKITLECMDELMRRINDRKIEPQPEIIRCKECKYRGETEDGEYNPEDIVCAYWMSDGLSETDYCSYAERRTNEVDYRKE